jgi:hypothetical protein
MRYIAVSLWCAACAFAAESDIRKAADTSGKFAALTAEADRVVIRKIGPKAKVVKEVTGRESVSSVGRLFTFTGEYATTVTHKGDDGEETLIMNCLCLGDYEFTFYRLKEERIRISVHHWSHVRSKSFASGLDTSISEPSATAIKEYISESDPEEAKEIRFIDDYMRKKDNQK